MKFLCGNCKAKYQIADEKVSGKTLRMKCRRCGHDILIDGHNMPASNPPAAAASASTRRGGTASVPVPTRAPTAETPRPVPAPPVRPSAARSKPPSALGTEFRRHMAAPPEVPQRAPYDLWHVAIKDVPVGPMTRAELGRKIETGAVTAESLCWREGMDDWRPLGELPELSQVLRRGFEGSRSGRLPSRPRLPVPAPQGPRVSSSQYPAVEELEEDPNEPTRVADSILGSSAAVAPVMQPGAHTVGTSPKIVLPQAAPLVAEVPVAVPAAVPERPARGNSQLITGVAIGLLVGIVVIGGPALYRATWGSTPAPAPTQPVASAPAAEKTASPSEPPPQVDIPNEEEKPAHTASKTKVGGTAIASRPVKPDPGKEGKQLSAEDQALLSRMGAGGSGGPNLSGRSQEEKTTASGPTLTPAQLTKVVQDNKVQLQRCYETALRAAGGKQEGTIKVTVSLTVGASGTTKLASTEGHGLGNMNDCIRSAVKRWRFPQSGGDTPFEFPLVFQPGA